MAAEKLKATKSELAQLLGFIDGYLVLTSGGTEANNLVIRGVLEKYPHGRLLLAADVHESAWFATKTYANRTDILPIDKHGKITPERFEKYLRSKTVLCSVLHGNNETGIIHDIDKLGSICVRKGILFHCDGVQAIGHIPVNLGSLAFDFYTFSAHKFAGVHGTGGIFLNRADFIPQIQGGGQEQKLRAGTENLPGLSATLTALKMSIAMTENEEIRLRKLAGKFITLLRGKINNMHLNSDLENGLPGLISLSFPDVKGSQLVTELSLMGFSISSGSACHSGEMSPSRIIANMGYSDNLALGTVRISMGRYTEEQQVEALARALIKAVTSQRALG
jgi:cysteine desulfurase